MNYVVLIVAISAVGASVWAKEIPFLIQDRLLSAARVIPPAYPGGCIATDYKPLTCLDCQKYSICYGDKVVSEKCPQESPFCIQTDLGDYCGNTPTCAGRSFICTSAGYFPDPLNCEYYHICPAAMGPSTVQSCNPGYFFNTEIEDCARKVKESDCAVIQCKKGEVWNRFGTSNKYFASCTELGGVTDYKLFKCTNGATFDGNTCNFSCTKAGKFPDTNYFDRFINCTKTGSVYEYTNEKCETTTIFNSQLGNCE